MHLQCSLGSVANAARIYADVRLYIPMPHHNDAGWWHQVWSEPGTVALSMVVRLGAGLGQWKDMV